MVRLNEKIAEILDTSDKKEVEFFKTNFLDHVSLRAGEDIRADMVLNYFFDELKHMVNGDKNG